MLSFSLFMLLIFTHCSRPLTSGLLTQDSTSGESIRLRPWTNRSGFGVLDMYEHVWV